jgi:hypothetical protein
MTKLRLGAALAAVCAMSAIVFAAPDQARSTTKVATTFTCAAELGTGAASKRRFCDVIVAAKAADSIAVSIPAHAGAATLLFDLHPRIDVPADDVETMQAFARHVAIVAVVRPTGAVIDRGIVEKEFRTSADLFDRIVGVRLVAPGRPEPQRMTIPAGVTSVGIVGVKLEVTRLRTQNTYDAVQRPIAVVSNIRVEYTPSR